MNIRESMEERELELLCPYAAYSGKSRGRDREEEECDVRTVYQWTVTGFCTARLFAE